MSPGHLGCSGLFIYLLHFKDYHCVLGKDLYDRIELRAGAPLTLNLVTSWFGGMTSSFVTVNFPVFYYANAIYLLNTFCKLTEIERKNIQNKIFASDTRSFYKSLC